MSLRPILWSRARRILLFWPSHQGKSATSIEGCTDLTHRISILTLLSGSGISHIMTDPQFLCQHHYRTLCFLRQLHSFSEDRPPTRCYSDLWPHVTLHKKDSNEFPVVRCRDFKLGKKESTGIGSAIGIDRYPELRNCNSFNIQDYSNKIIVQ